MSAPDIGDELDPLEFGVKQKRHVDFSARIDENEVVNGDVRFGDQPNLGGRSMTITQLQHAPQVKSALKRKDEQISIEDYVNSRSNKNFVGDCTAKVPDPLYERYVHWNRPQHWERDNESVKIYFESYLRDNNLSVDDAQALKNAQSRAGATFKLQHGPYAGLDQNVKARVLVVKKLRTEPEDQEIFEDSMDYKKLMSTNKSTIPPDSVELYKSFFDDPLPEVAIYPKSKSMAEATSSSSTPENAAALKLSEELRKLTLAARRRPMSRTARFGGHELISVGPLLKLDGGKDEEFIMFNEAAAENAFADAVKNETELSFYAK